jgi:ATP-dependent DNA helicase RecG
MLSSVEKIQKFFKLEIERGFDNRAVVGGLDKILPAWESEARANRLNEEIIQVILDGLRAYPGLDTPERSGLLSQLMERLEQAQGEPAAPGQPQSEGKTAPAQELPPARLPPAPREQQPARKASRQQAPQDAKIFPAPEEQSGLNAPVRVLPGVGNRLSQTLNSLGLNTLEDLLFYFPRRYDDYSQLKPINRLTYGEVTTVLGTIQSIFTRPIRGGKLQITEAVVSDGTGALRVTWFNQPWLAGKYPANTQVVLAGKVDQYLGRPTMSGPEIEAVEQEHLHTNRIVPVYPLTSGLTQKNLRRIMYQTITYWAPRVQEYLPEEVRSAVKMIPLSTALINVHFPESQDMLDVARWRLAFDEIFLLQTGVLRQKRTWQAAEAEVFSTPQDWLDQQVSRLPFRLTGAQQRVLEEVRADLASGRPMDRLIQGDVGSGKTVIAAMAVWMVARHGAQAAVMAPTSILAEQHYRSLTRLLAQTGETGEAGEAPALPPLRAEEIRLLIGDTPENEKEEIRQGLENGSIKLVIGTHALIESPVQFQHLQLAVVDEQHRFGVAQRSALRAKGVNPHLLVMTATPIPRSLALTVYGDLDLSVMDEMPPGRQPVDTFVLAPLERERAYQLIRSQVAAGSQAFIIYPLVEQNGETEDLPKENQGMLLSAVEEHQRLQKGIFPGLKVGLLHGRLKPEEKDQVMRAFRNGEYAVLVSTTVVEVGVDIPNATVMLIEGANRFGLAQLHQLRGRVGRGGAQSFCLLIPDKEDAVENERLAVMSETNDGFVLAEKDLQQRGPGEFLGTRQAGYSELKMANLTDVRLIEKARQQAQLLFQNDCDLSAPGHQLLAKKLEEFWEGGRGDIS